MELFRIVTLPDGQQATVPRGIQRIDSGKTHGWQVRHAGTKFFSDGASGWKWSLFNATNEMIERMALSEVRLPNVPVPKADPTLPLGISGPQQVVRKKRRPYLEYCVALPRFGKKATIRKVYAGTVAATNVAMMDKALTKAQAIRDKAVQAWEMEAQRKHLADINGLKQFRSLMKKAGLEL